jgi:hypothetical protein
MVKERERSIVRYKGYNARRRTVRNKDFILAAAIIGIGGVFLVMTTLFSLKIGAASVFAILCFIAVFISADIVMFIFVFLLCFVILLPIGGLVLTIQDMAMLLMLLAFLAQMASLRKVQYPAGYYTLACALFLMSMILSSLASANIAKTLPQIIQFFYYIIAIPFIVMNIVRNSTMVKKFLYIHATLLIAHALLIIAQYFLAARGNFVIRELFPTANRGDFSLRSFGSLGSVAGLHFAVACVVFVSSYYLTRKLPGRLFYLAAIGICIFASVCTGIRSLTAMICLASIFYVLYKKKYVHFAAISLIFLILLAVVLQIGPDVYPFKLFYHGEGFRAVDIQQAMGAFYNHPLLGVGPVQFMRYRGSFEVAGVENEFISILAEVGLAGGISFILMVGAILWALLPVLKSKNDERRETTAVLLFIYLVYLGAAFTVSDMFHGGQAHMFMMLHGYALRLYADEKSELAPGSIPLKAKAAPAAQ